MAQIAKPHSGMPNKKVIAISRRLQRYLNSGHGKHIASPREHIIDLLVKLHKQAATQEAKAAIFAQIKALRDPALKGIPAEKLATKTAIVRRREIASRARLGRLPRNKAGFELGKNLLALLEKSATRDIYWRLLANDWAIFAHDFQDIADNPEEIAACWKNALRAAKRSKSAELESSIKEIAKTHGFQLE